MRGKISYFSLVIITIAFGAQAADPAIALFDEVEHHYVDSDGVSIHYVSSGEGPVVLFVHGFGHWWYDWRNQMAALVPAYKVVAMDTRGYNKSDKPVGRENYRMELLLNDLEAVINDLGVEKVTLVAHDWGASISWRFAAFNPDYIENLIIIGLTHPKPYMEVFNNGTEEQQANTAYIRRIYESDELATTVDPQQRAVRRAENEWDADNEIIKSRNINAYRQTAFEQTPNYYRNVYPMLVSGEYADIPMLEMPVLQIHGLEDRPVHKDGIRDTWNYVGQDYTVMTLPGIGHDPQHEAPEIVNATIINWLKYH